MCGTNVKVLKNVADLTLGRSQRVKVCLAYLFHGDDVYCGTGDLGGKEDIL